MRRRHHDFSAVIYEFITIGVSCLSSFVDEMIKKMCRFYTESHKIISFVLIISIYN